MSRTTDPAAGQQQTDPGQIIAELRGQLNAYDAEQYPVQHATARFHLGGTLIRVGMAKQAAAHLRRACELFPVDGLPVEHGKATNMLGIALREVGPPEAAAEAFDRASEILIEEGQLVEGAAARYNRGLVRLDMGDHDIAGVAFESARDTFADAGALGQAAMAGQQLGALLLQEGELRRAAAALEQAVEHAADAADEAAMGTAANTLGLVHLQAGDLEAAREAFEKSVAGNPRSVRPEAYAMAKANLALACEGADLPARARMAARQALALDEAAEPVVEQARGILERLGEDVDDVHAVLADEPQDRWSKVLRAELRRLVDVDDEDRLRHAEAWVEGQLGDDARPVELAEAYLDVLLELPPDAMETLITSFVLATGRLPDGDAERIRSTTARAMARFRVPQLMRLRDTFNEIAEQRGEPAAWE